MYGLCEKKQEKSLRKQALPATATNKNYLDNELSKNTVGWVDGTKRKQDLGRVKENKGEGRGI